ncbi:CCGSCS motif protein [Undibacterium terreum]|uniref:HMA domain-containing protein n=1 Tax=Undibacterium terreum TaxID=1224302 RepID=A0A916X9N9_9BURK|nr:CCGSCS motif protein [Undibacterium terreum]GGC57464.1 hypothetical protein GCM10011396_00370 [Undibacterium terreum]
MQTETLKLDAAGHSNYTLAIESLLKQTSGVRDVLVVEPKQECSILFDETTVTLQQLQTILSHAGYASQKAKPKHGQNGVCCGSCGG